MNPKLACLFFLLYGAFSFSQTPQSLANDVKELYTAFDEIDIGKLSEMICSPGNESVYDKLDAYFLNDNYKFRYVFTNVTYNFAPVKTIGGKSYCAVNFRNVVRITYFKPIDVAEIQKALKEKFKAQSIVYEKARNSFMIAYQAKMTAISETGPAIWKFAFNDNTLPPEISEGCFPDDIRKELGIN